MTASISSIEILGKPSIKFIDNSDKNAQNDTSFDAFKYMISCLFENMPDHTQFFVVMDSKIESLYFQNFQKAFADCCTYDKVSRYLFSFQVPVGEPSKCNTIHQMIQEYVLTNLPQPQPRSLCIIALGGGVIGDLTGYVASTLMRGTPVVQIPTTLLAMVDSSIGGKTGIDVPNVGKNLIGSIWQPRLILLWPGFLQTLDKRQVCNGLAEVIKYGVIWTRKILHLIEHESDRGLGLIKNQNLLGSLIWECAHTKANIVSQDERESNLRSVLNFGHTIGHAIEACLTPELLHGEAVSIGMILEMEVARILGHIDQGSVNRVKNLLKQVNLPVSLHEPRIQALVHETGKCVSVDYLMNYMNVDKKNIGGKKRIVLIKAIGQLVEPQASFVNDDIIRFVLSESVVINGPKSFSLKSNSNDVLEITVPGSKSISNRVLVMAALGKGECRIRGLLHSDDTEVMLNGLRKLSSFSYEWEENGSVLKIIGSNGNLIGTNDNEEIYLGNAGTAARFLTSVCLLVNDTKKSTILTGNSRMKQRPIGPLVDALRANSSTLKYLENEGCLPLEISGGGFNGGSIRLSASVSSQYVSSVLLAAPYAHNDVTLILGGINDGENEHVVSQPYIDMTIRMMESFGVVVRRDKESPNVYHIVKGGYKNPKEYHVEPDASSATYPLAIAAALGNAVKLKGLDSRSLQGDAGFARLLQKMGCTVEMSSDQDMSAGIPDSDSFIKVTGPSKGGLCALGDIDMENMTDAFLTASVLAGIACKPNSNFNDNLVTKIHGISNQRVKECDRILAMKNELEKFGIESWELEDGIAIRGIGDLSKIDRKRPYEEGIDCYDDHRVAMSFSVLSLAISPMPVLIKEKRCVEKTFPEWWDTLLKDFGVSLEGKEIKSPLNYIKISKMKSKNMVVIIGMRGSGKTLMGKRCASELGLDFIDLDSFIETENKSSIPEIIDQKGWDYFREKELESFAKAVTKSDNLLISCGGGIVEREENRALLQSLSQSIPVINLHREIQDIISYLATDDSRPSFSQDILKVWTSRKPLYEQCSNFDFFMGKTKGIYDWETLERDFAEFIRRIMSGKPKTKNSIPSDRLVIDEYSCRNCSYFTSLTFDDLKLVPPEKLLKICEAADAIELRVDLLKSNETTFVSDQVSYLRQVIGKPIVYTVRTSKQGGKFPSENHKELQSLVELGIRLGCEYIDLEMSKNEKDVLEIKKKGISQIIASFHVTDHQKDTWRRIIPLVFPVANMYGDIIKLIGYAGSFNDNFELWNFVRGELTSGCNKPIIAINMGEKGALTRVMNCFMTPVTHPELPSKAAAGQLSIAEINQMRQNLGIIPKEKYFYLFGSPIQKSMSPMLHNTGLDFVGLTNFRYVLHETEKVDENILNLMRETTFGGSSVTIPLKEKIMKHLDTISECAKRVGAVNTIVAARNSDGIRVLEGYNTDYMGIMKVILKNLSSELRSSPLNVLVLGAGGTSRAACFAARNLPNVISLFVWNRTKSKAQLLAKDFNAKVVDFEAGGAKVFEASSKQTPSFDVVISTIPAGTHYELPEDLKNSIFTKFFGVYVELGYVPRRSLLLEKAESQSWAVVEGIEILIEQGFEQFKLWFGMNPPENSMRRKVMETYDKSLV